ncbi:MAG: UDP-N-acetylmuramate dehydrogenase [Anaerohalosphaeraceae bacterium]|nr:UDP-N-acetylmuramate dehydrogenase [Anaerohalosphaeraceae bacterium]
MSIFDGLKGVVETDYPLGQMSWFKIGGNADYFVRPTTVAELAEVVKICRENNLPIHVLGFGSNLLVRDGGVKGVVVKLAGGDFERAEFDGTNLVAWAGVDLGGLVRDCVKRGLAGLEALAGIPGSVGGAVRMNAGGNFGDFGSAIESVTLMDNQGDVFEKSKPELSFDYREVNITAPIILNAKIKLCESLPQQLLRAFQEVWIYKKNTQPLSSHSAGCVFKNPRGMSAGAMIDRAALKGTKVGGAMVSEKHANFIIADDDCKSDDVIALIEQVREKVKERFDVEMELEIEIW